MLTDRAQTPTDNAQNIRKLCQMYVILEIGILADQIESHINCYHVGYLDARIEANSEDGLELRHWQHYENMGDLRKRNAEDRDGLTQMRKTKHLN